MIKFFENVLYKIQERIQRVFKQVGRRVNVIKLQLLIIRQSAAEAHGRMPSNYNLMTTIHSLTETGGVYIQRAGESPFNSNRCLFYLWTHTAGEVLHL